MFCFKAQIWQYEKVNKQCWRHINFKNLKTNKIDIQNILFPIITLWVPTCPIKGQKFDQILLFI